MDSKNRLIHNIKIELLNINIHINENIIENLLSKLYINSSNSIINNIEYNIDQNINSDIDYSLGEIYYTPELKKEIRILRLYMYNDIILNIHKNLNYIDYNNKIYHSTIISPNSSLLIDEAPDIHTSIYKFIEFLYTYESKFKYLLYN